MNNNFFGNFKSLNNLRTFEILKISKVFYCRLLWLKQSQIFIFKISEKKLKKSLTH